MNKLKVFIIYVMLTLLCNGVYSQYVAKVGERNFASVVDAFKSANDGETVTITSDAKITKQISIENKSITLDLQNFNLIGDEGSYDNNSLFRLPSGGTLTIKGTGSIRHTTSKGCEIVYVSGGTLNLVGGTLSSSITATGVVYVSGGTFNMNGGVVENLKDSKTINITDEKHRGIFISSNANANLNKGKVNSNVTAISQYSTGKATIGESLDVNGFIYAVNPDNYTSIPSKYLIFTNQKSYSDSKNNVVYNIMSNTATCKNLLLTDEVRYSSPKEIKATKSSYTRKMTNNWGTLCLPFVIDIEKSDVDCYGITAVSNDELVLSKYAENVEAGVPVVIRKKEDKAEKINVVGASNSTTVISSGMTDMANAKLYGTFEDIIISNTENDNYYFIANNMFYNAKKATQTPRYRSYFTCKNDCYATSPSFNLIVSDNELTHVSGLTEQGGENPQIKSIHNLLGIGLHELTKGVNIVTFSDGTVKKITVK